MKTVAILTAIGFNLVYAANQTVANPPVTNQTVEPTWQRDKTIHWAMDCEFVGNDMKAIKSRGEDCSDLCRANIGCTSFTWFSNTCTLKTGQVNLKNVRGNPGYVCGYVIGSESKNWINSDTENIRWSVNCDIDGTQLQTVNAPVDQCPALCKSAKDCSIFSWTPKNSGTCSLKSGTATDNSAVFSKESSVCGYVITAPPPPPPPLKDSAAATLFGFTFELLGFHLVFFLLSFFYYLS